MSASNSVDNRMEGQQRRGHVYRGLINIVEFIKGFAVSLFSSSPGSGVVQRVGDRVYYRDRKQSCYHHAAENNYYDTARSLVLFSGLIPKQLFDSTYLCLEA